MNLDNWAWGENTWITNICKGTLAAFSKVRLSYQFVIVYFVMVCYILTNFYAQENFASVHQNSGQGNLASRHPGLRLRVPFSGSKFFHFHTVFGKKFAKYYVSTATLGVAPPPSGKSWIRHKVRIVAKSIEAIVTAIRICF